MDFDIPERMAGIPLQYQLYAVYIAAAFKILGPIISAIRTGGGLKRMIMSVWLGETLPKVIADDYKVELSKPPFVEKTGGSIAIIPVTVLTPEPPKDIP